MTGKQITQSVIKSDTEKSKFLKILIHYFVILSISFCFTILAIENSSLYGENGVLKCNNAEIERIVEDFLVKKEFIQKNGGSSAERKFGYLHDDQENDAPRNRVKKSVELTGKGSLKAEHFHILIVILRFRG